MKKYNVILKAKDGSRQHMSFMAKDKADAKLMAERLSFRRESRFDLTFARLEEAKETGKPGMLAIDPRMTGKALTEAWVKAETEKRKKDQARYEAGFTIEKIEEAKS
jgi:hypothetical protein